MMTNVSIYDADTHQAETAERIRQAERDINAGEYQEAREKLLEVRRTDPSNGYVAAIIERVETLMRESGRAVPQLQHLTGTPLLGNEVEREITLSMVRRFEGAISWNGDSPVTSESIESRVQRLTTVANQLFERGCYESALESFLKARTLDPGSSHVRSCEQTIRPAIELMKRRQSISRIAVPLRALGEEEASPHVSEFLEQPAARTSPVAPPSAPVVPVGLREPQPEQTRLEMLNRRWEIERREREREMWRQASSPPHPVEGRSIPLGSVRSTHQEEEGARRMSALLAKLRGGKLLG